MSTESDQAREIAERVARRLSDGTSGNRPRAEVSSELAAVRAGINELQRKLAQLEAKVTSDPVTRPDSTTRPSMISGGRRSAPSTHSPWLAGINTSYSHPSEEKFGVEEATVSELVDFFEKEKLCSIEPGGKPCDHCAMCSSRGF
jgi:CRISPR/Cas system-associated protein Cas10 (large subunit of type III CRISPR-Cas system)